VVQLHDIKIDGFLQSYIIYKLSEHSENIFNIIHILSTTSLLVGLSLEQRQLAQF